MTEPENMGAAAPGPRRKKILLIALGVAAVLIVALAATLIVRGGGHKVRYEIETSSGNANGILWSLGGPSQFDKKVPDSPGGTVSTPWSKTVTFKDENQLAALTTEVASGTATCRIFVDGKKVDEATHEGQATCQVRVS
ncbi:hypothetical protein ACQPZX_17445 [Actinoplanes sp. CA-142083]|uniref:hypothetical protein n=1 Tax=Actinoplanes sp. CA-142083 TaxID=3239903 RepID=UPI003D8B4F7E